MHFMLYTTCNQFSQRCSLVLKEIISWFVYLMKNAVNLRQFFSSFYYMPISNKYEISSILHTCRKIIDTRFSYLDDIVLSSEGLIAEY